MSTEFEKIRRTVRRRRTMIIVAKHTLVRTSIVKFLEYELADCNVVGMASLTELVKGKRAFPCALTSPL